MAPKVITYFQTLLQYARAEATAKKEYIYACDLNDEDKKMKARQNYDEAVEAHKTYKQICLDSDEMIC